jgi:hypothetical protein
MSRLLDAGHGTEREEAHGREPASWRRRGLVPAAAILVAAAAISVVVLHGGTRPQLTDARADGPAATANSGSSDDVGPPDAASGGPAEAATVPPGPSGTDAPASDGPPVTISAAGLIEHDHVRYEVGQPGDVVAVGDVGCDGRDRAIVLRPSTGEVFAFDGWATPGTDATASVVTTVSSGAGLTTGPPGPCAPLAVRLADGTTIPLALPGDTSRSSGGSGGAVASGASGGAP